VLRALFEAGCAVDLVVSRAARLTILDETGAPFRDAHWRADLTAWLGADLASADLVHWPAGDLAAGPSSGSYPARGMVVVPRETPVTRGHLQHLLTLHDAGAVILPASPGFYSAGAQASAEELIDFVAGKVLDAIDVAHTLITRWEGLAIRPARSPAGSEPSRAEVRRAGSARARPAP
jgi:4-hydroxy-3-polyprenylbenzoate decarboxylase